MSTETTGRSAGDAGQDESGASSTSQADWGTTQVPDEGRLFFDAHQWDVIEAAAERIIPADHDPGAKDAGVVRFIDRYLAGHVYATADGGGFLVQTGKAAEAWAQRTRTMQERYARGVRDIEGVSSRLHGHSFTDLDAGQQDEVLVEVSGRPKPGDFVERMRAAGKLAAQGEQRSASGVDLSPAEEGGAPPSNQPVPDDALDFFPMLLLHVRQGFYADPAYGGNRDRVGWRTIGFPGPTSLAQTQRGEFSTDQYLLPEMEWPYTDQ